ncbi:MAG: hypothetical protein R3A12_03565 [Ignavibacteria bacterium]
MKVPLFMQVKYYRQKIFLKPLYNKGTNPPRLSENNSDIPASKARRLKEEHFEGFYLGVFEP